MALVSADPFKTSRSTLPRLEAALHLVDHIDPALAANQAVGAVTATQRFQRVTDLHVKNPGCLSKAVGPYLAKKGFSRRPAWPVRDGAVSIIKGPNVNANRGFCPHFRVRRLRLISKANFGPGTRGHTRRTLRNSLYGITNLPSLETSRWNPRHAQAETARHREGHSDRHPHPCRGTLWPAWRRRLRRFP